MDASYAIRRKTEDSIVQYFGDVSASKTDVLSEELTELKDRARESGSVWNLEELLELLGRLIQSDQEKLEVEKERLEQAECILRSKQEALATAQTNNEFIDRLLYLQKERAELATRGQKIKDSHRSAGQAENSHPGSASSVPCMEIKSRCCDLYGKRD